MATVLYSPVLSYSKRTLTVLNLTGVVCLLFSVIYIPSFIISILYSDHEFDHLLSAFLICIVTGLTLWLPTRQFDVALQKKEGFLIVVFFWLVLSVLGALPFILSLHASVYDALFESVSGLTTTGATVLSDLDHLPASVLFYRQALQWFGGIGLVILAVLVIPRLGIGGMSIYMAETPGPMKDEKLTPRLIHSSKIIWIIYIALTIACALAYWLAGMNAFDAIAHSLTTVSTGGFSTHDLSLGYFHSPAIESIAMIFMLMGAINFSVHYYALRKGRLQAYLEDDEVRSFLIIVCILILIPTVTLYLTDYYNNLWSDLRSTAFEVVSVITSTGYGISDNFPNWPLFLPLFFILISFIGGCGGSTAGGMKVMRILVLLQLYYREMLKLIHPNGVFTVKINGKPMQDHTLQSIFGFFALYVASFLLLLLLMMSVNVDEVSAFSAIATCMNNLGPGLGHVADSFAGLNDAAKSLSIFAMLIGRLEIVTVLILFSPSFWRS